LGVFDAASLWVRDQVFVASGGITLVLLLIVERTILGAWLS